VSCESPALFGTTTLQSAHYFVLERHVLRQCEVLVVGVIEQEGERQLRWATAGVSPFEARGTVVRQLETPIWGQRFAARILFDDCAASLSVADVDDVGLIRSV
jgi:hypothetical protein